MRIGVAMLNWGDPADTIRCVFRLQEGARKPDRIVVCDNGSAGDTAERIVRAIPQACLLRNATNIGFAAGMNRAVEHVFAAGMDAVWILNNDAMADLQCLAALEDELAHQSGVAAVTGKILNTGTPATLQYGGAVWNDRLMLYEGKGAGQPDEGQCDTPGDVPFVSGCSLVIPRAPWSDVGPFHEPFFAYWEDADWSRRALRKGYRLLYQPAAVVLHAQHESTKGNAGLRHYLYTRNHFHFIRRHAASRRRLIGCMARAVRLHLGASARLLVRGQLGNAARTLEGVVDGLGRIDRPLFFRRVLSSSPAVLPGEPA